MKDLYTILFVLVICLPLYGQEVSLEKKDIISLGQVYKDYMFQNAPSKKYLKSFESQYSSELGVEVDFIKQTISQKNDLLDEEYLNLPNESVLKNIYFIREINLNLREESGTSSSELLDSLLLIEVPRYELVDNYYEMLFTGVGNKNKPFDLSKYNFKPRDYQLQDETEIGIFFLKCMNLCGTNIWGYMNIVKPPNTKEALSYIGNFPRINSQPYYQFTDLYFEDFEMIIIDDEGLQSYKSYYLNKYYETLLSHLICLDKEGRGGEEIRDLLLGSILKDSDLYKYTEYKDVLEGIFQKKK